jgi:hypothetical protein
MQGHIDIKGAWLTALFDSGPTHNFVDTEAAAHARIQLGGGKNEKQNSLLFPKKKFSKGLKRKQTKKEVRKLSHSVARF